MLKKKDEEMTNANTTVTTLKNHVSKLVGENFLWKKIKYPAFADAATPEVDPNGEMLKV
ncbi:hypothetical protein QJS10_CPA08g00529 [Acorus calamus]|uniref:Uncharacterized protein n=1 Tax=Acorus calamus TaxID=4465 RepID=A0AAV9EDB0_ACOCL|nr:hypothetical protein QJS10_CPA08g00529 [Acorus calamus]